MDYDKLIDAETWAFINRTGAFYPPDATEMSIAQQRRVYDQMCEAFRQPRPEGIFFAKIETFQACPAASTR